MSRSVENAAALRIFIAFNVRPEHQGLLKSKFVEEEVHLLVLHFGESKPAGGSCQNLKQLRLGAAVGDGTLRQCCAGESPL